MKKKSNSISYFTYLNPKYSYGYLVIMLIWIISKLPTGISLAIGHGIGLLVYYFGKRRADITRTNIRICFKELSEQEQESLVKQSFIDHGKSVVEYSRMLFGKSFIGENSIAKFTSIGHEAVLEELNRGKPIIFLGNHHACLELGAAFSIKFLKRKCVASYTPMRNPIFELLLKNRKKYAIKMISSKGKKTVTDTIRALKNKDIYWFATDQDVSGKSSIFAPFFGQTASCITTCPYIAKKLNVSVYQFMVYREDNISFNKPHYSCRFVKMGSENRPYPTDDILADITYQNEVLEELIRYKPSQYLWQHKKFKTQPDGSNIYKV